MTELEYWKTRCELAEQCLDASPCDPDITFRQTIVTREYVDFIKSNPEPPKELKPTI